MSLTPVRVILRRRVLHPPSGRVQDAGRHPPWPPGVRLSGVRPARTAPLAAADNGGVETGAGPDELVCSARGCRARGSWGLRWNNPRLHEAARRKTWLACPDHREDLESFLSVRGFLREVVPVEELGRAHG